MDSEFFKDFRLLFVDLPGHGGSSFPKDPANDYSPLRTAEILSCFIKKLLDNKPFIPVGISYGTNLVAEMIQFDLEPVGMVLISPCVLGERHSLDKIFVANTSPSIFIYNESDISRVSVFFNENMAKAQELDINNAIEDYIRVDPVFKAAMFQAAAGGIISDEISLLHKTGIPICVIFGEEDKSVNTSYLDDFPFNIWQDKILKIAGAGHWPNLEDPSTINNLIYHYAVEKFKADHA